MAITLTINGITYQYPAVDEPAGTWGQNATNWALAVSTNTLQPTGGVFTLSADVDFGASFGLISTYLKSASLLLSLYQRSGLQYIARKTQLLQKLGLSNADALLPKMRISATKIKKSYPAIGTIRGNVSLFTGCISTALDVTTLNAGIHLLTHLGYGVQVPSQQTCCGAIHIHNGMSKQAAVLAKENQSAFGNAPETPILSMVSGCSASIKRSIEAANDGHWSNRIVDISQFILEMQTLWVYLSEFSHFNILPSIN